MCSHVCLYVNEWVFVCVCVCESECSNELLNICFSNNNNNNNDNIYNALILYMINKSKRAFSTHACILDGIHIHLTPTGENTKVFLLPKNNFQINGLRIYLH